jgi:hypothetical protein
MAYGDMGRPGTPGAPAKGMGSASSGKSSQRRGKNSFGSLIGMVDSIAAMLGNPSNRNPSSPPISDKGQGSDNPDRLPSGAGPGGTRVKYTFAGANPLYTSGFPVGHPNYKPPPGSPGGADAVRANIINKKKKITGSTGSSGSLTSTGSSAIPALLGT